MKALIIFQDFAAAAKANAALQHAVQHADLSIQWSINPYRADLLKFPPTAEVVLDAARDANLIVLAGRSEQSLPVWLQDWLEHWAECRQIDNAALAVIYTGNADPLPPVATPGLSAFANHHGLDFIFGDNLAIAPSSMADRSALVEDRLHEPEPPPHNLPGNNLAQSKQLNRITL